MTLTPEQELLVYCARLHLDPAHSQRVRDLLAGSLDFDALLHTAHVHGVLPLLGRHVLTEGGDSLPRSACENLRQAVRAIAARNALRTAELVRVLTLLRAAGILAVAFKGPVAALAAYGNLALREFRDLDVLVHQKDLDAAAGVLTHAGYRALDSLTESHAATVRRTGYNHEFVHAGSGAVIELHWRFGPAWFHFPLSLECLAERLTSLTVRGVDLPVLGLEDTLLVLCAHGTKHLWTRLEWICLVAELIRRHDSIDWAELTARASIVGARRMVGLGLWLAQDVLNLPVAPEAARCLSSDTAVRSLGGDLVARLFRSGSQSPPPWTIAVATFRARERSRDRWRQVLGLAFEPTIADVTTLRLPRRLAWLYYVTRLVRLTWTYGCIAAVRHRPNLRAPRRQR